MRLLPPGRAAACLFFGALVSSCLGDSGRAIPDDPGMAFRLDLPAEASPRSIEQIRRIELARLTPPVISIRDALLLPGGDIVVVDWRQHRVVRIGSAGAVRSVFGREGDGPGEFRSPTHVMPLGTDSLLIYDNELSRFSVFDMDGNLGRTFKPSWTSEGMTVSHLLPAPEGLLLGLSVRLHPRALRALVGTVKRDSIRLVLADYAGAIGDGEGVVVADRLWTATIEHNAFLVSILPEGPRALVATTSKGVLVIENTSRWVEVLPWDSIAATDRLVLDRTATPKSESEGLFGTMVPDGRDGAWVTERSADSRGRRRWYRISHDGSIVYHVLAAPVDVGLLAALSDTLLTRTQDSDGNLVLATWIVR